MDQTLDDEEPTGENNYGDDFFPEPEGELKQSRAPLTVRGVAIIGARVVTGVVVLGGAAAVVSAAALVPLPTVTATAVTELITPVPTAQQLLCPGSLLQLSDESGAGATRVSALGQPAVASAAGLDAVNSAALLQSDANTQGTDASPTVLTAPAAPAGSPERLLLSGAQVQQIGSGEIMGLAASDCSVASADIWLAGGATLVGRTTLLIMSNPTEVDATVTLELFGEDGPITAPGTSGIVVPARGQRVLSLAGFAPEQSSLVVHLTSSGGQVVAGLQQSTVRGLVPGGVDFVGSTTGPSLENVIPGLLVSGAGDIENNLGTGPGFEDLQTILRVFVPGATPAKTIIRVIPEDGSGTGTALDFSFDAGRVVDVPIPNLANGNYTVLVTSDLPLVAAARVSAASGSSTDFAWLAAAPALTDSAQVTVAPGPVAAIHIANPGTEAVTVTLVARGGSGDLSAQIAAGAAVSVPARPGESYAVQGVPWLHAAVTLADSGVIAHYPARPPGAGSSPVLVYP